MVDPITGGFIDWMCGKLGDSVLQHLCASTELAIDIDKAIAKWAKSLPRGRYVNPKSLFPEVDPSTAKNERPEYFALQVKLVQNELPEKKVWHAVFMESWRWVKNNVEEPQPFFHLNEAKASNDLERLGQSTYNVCVQYEPIFKRAVIGKLDRLDGRMDGFNQYLQEILVAVKEGKRKKGRGLWAGVSVPSIDLKIAPTRLRHGADHLFGREQELAALDQTWKNPSKHILTIVAWGGVGKTSLVVEWMARKAAANWPDFDRVFDWSFYSQGTREHGAASTDTFIVTSLEFFGDPVLARSASSSWEKGARLAQLVAQRRTLLVLDGLEPLHHTPGPLAGQLRDPALAALLLGLAQRNPGLCLVTTREHVADLVPFRDTTAPEWKLENLSKEAGARVLHRAGVRKAGAVAIKEDDTELLAASCEVEGHALTLRLLGGYLSLAHDGDIRKRDIIQFKEADAEFKTNPADADKRIGHAFKIMAAYEHWMADGGKEGQRQLVVLRMLGLFDRPADAGCLAALRRKPAIPGLTEPRVSLRKKPWNISLKRLEECGLLSLRTQRSSLRSSQRPLVETHPLVREYFAQQLREKNPEAWLSAHRRLYEHLKKNTKYWPDTLEGLLPLYQAVEHGCEANLHREVILDVYVNRIERGRRFSTVELGAFSATLGAIAHFFDRQWSRPVSALPKVKTKRERGGVEKGEQAWLLNEAASCLRAMGRVEEALEPSRAALKHSTNGWQWPMASASAIILSELELILGEIDRAMRHARQAIRFAEYGGFEFYKMWSLVNLADGLHQAGHFGDALARFHEAEKLQAKIEPKFRWLYSAHGFKYCDLLLSEPERTVWQLMQNLKPETRNPKSQETCHEVEQRAAKTIKIAERNKRLLDIALDHLTMGRTALYFAILNQSNIKNQESKIGEARQHLTDAVDWLRNSGNQDYIARGLLSRAWLRFLEGDADGARTDLDEACQIAERGPMRLQMADIHLHHARFFRDKESLAKARKLIEQCGYHRRDEEIADAELAAVNW